MKGVQIFVQGRGRNGGLGQPGSSKSLADASQSHLSRRARKPGCVRTPSCPSRTLSPKPCSLPHGGSRGPVRLGQEAGPL